MTDSASRALFLTECIAWLSINYFTFGQLSWYYLLIVNLNLPQSVVNSLYAKYIFSPSNFVDYTKENLLDVSDLGSFINISIDVATLVIYKITRFIVFGRQAKKQERIKNIPINTQYNIAELSDKNPGLFDLTNIFIDPLILANLKYCYGLFYLEKSTPVNYLGVATNIQTIASCDKKGIIQTLFPGIQEGFY